MTFQSHVYLLCKQVPAGKVTTYKAIGDALGIKGYRAVGNALNKNPFGFLECGNIPCHRVVCSDGRVGGFAHGVEKKIELLKKEGIVVRDGKVVDFEILFLLSTKRHGE
ncbi:MAG TPA: MGMT family protein [Candidatus Nanoarchaeia archaeon]|nr:MGMT family protein [Candidatus Nanoarchaeia archaeon]